MPDATRLSGSFHCTAGKGKVLVEMFGALGQVQHVESAQQGEPFFPAPPAPV